MVSYATCSCFGEDFITAPSGLDIEKPEEMSKSFQSHAPVYESMLQTAASRIEQERVEDVLKEQIKQRAERERLKIEHVERKHTDTKGTRIKSERLRDEHIKQEHAEQDRIAKEFSV